VYVWGVVMEALPLPRISLGAYGLSWPYSEWARTNGGMHMRVSHRGVFVVVSWPLTEPVLLGPFFTRRGVRRCVHEAEERVLGSGAQVSAVRRASLGPAQGV
jgi:hypothetical protein